jgi:GNAT superfamily N-acetyltransferase
MFTGDAMRPYLADLARLRLAVFREFPYLYDGSLAEEQASVAGFGATPGAGLAVAFDGETVVGCATCQPLATEPASIQLPFRALGWDVAAICYFGESVLLAPHRGRGAGVGFLKAREAHAMTLAGCTHAAFCAVIRPDDHPLRPAGHTRLDGFWQRRGFRPVPELVCTMRWKQVDTEAKVENRLAFWVKRLGAAA